MQCGERPDASPAQGELLLRVEACGVGLTVLNCIRGDLGHEASDLPRVPGHEIVGVVIGAGPGVARGWLGQRVVVFFYLFCGTCQECQKGREALCTQLAGYMGVQRDGGYAELVTVPVRNAVRVSDALDPVLATAIPDAIATPVHVARRAGLAPGERVVVIAAAGGVGVHMVQVALLHGALVAGLEAKQSKLEALEREFDISAVDSTDFSEIRLPGSWHGRADVVVDLLGTSESSGWAATVLDRGGRLVLLTTFRDVEFALSQRAAVLEEITVLGSRYASRDEVQTAAEYVESQKVIPIVSEVAPWTEVEALHEHLRAGTLWGRGALDWNHAPPGPHGD